MSLRFTKRSSSSSSNPVLSATIYVIHPDILYDYYYNLEVVDSVRSGIEEEAKGAHLDFQRVGSLYVHEMGRFA